MSDPGGFVPERLPTAPRRWACVVCDAPVPDDAFFPGGDWVCAACLQTHAFTNDAGTLRWHLLTPAEMNPHAPEKQRSTDYPEVTHNVE